MYMLIFLNLFFKFYFFYSFYIEKIGANSLCFENSPIQDLQSSLYCWRTKILIFLLKNSKRAPQPEKRAPTKASIVLFCFYEPLNSWSFTEGTNGTPIQGCKIHSKTFISHRDVPVHFRSNIFSDFCTRSEDQMKN